MGGISAMSTSVATVGNTRDDSLAKPRPAPLRRLRPPSCTASRAATLPRGLDPTSTLAALSSGVSLAAALRGSPALTQLDAGWNRFKDDAAVALCSAIVDCPNLRAVDLGFNPLGSAAAAALGQALRVSTSLVRLNLSFVRFDSEAWLRVGRGAGASRSLDFIGATGTDEVGEDGCALLRGVQSAGRRTPLEVAFRDGTVTCAGAVADNK